MISRRGELAPIVLIWLGSDKEPKKLINSCTLEWEEARANGGVVKVPYKKMQSLHTSHHFILVGVPMDIDLDSLQTIMETKMEEARAKMVKRNPSKYGAIRRVPRFTLVADFIKNTPFAERSDKDDIPFWAKMPHHIECLAISEDKIKAILAFMYRVKRFQGLFGEAVFYFKNPRLEASAGERTILAGVLTCHIAMVWLKSRIILKGLIHPDRRFPLQQYWEDEPNELEIDVTRLVREIMMEAIVKRSKVWALIAQLSDGQWAGYFRHGIENDLHKKYAHEWAGSVSAHFCFHLAKKCLLVDGIDKMIKGCFAYQEFKDAANAIQGKDGKVKSARQAMAEQVLADFDQKQKWVDNTLGMICQQKEEHKQEQAVQAKVNEQLCYNFDEENPINPVEGRANNRTAFTITQHVSLGGSEFEVIQKDSRSKSDEEGLLKNL
jgi:hypothetical protein